MTTIPNEIITAYISIVFIIGFVGNLSTIIVIIRYRELQNTTHYYILNLAVASILMTLSIPMRIATLFNKNGILCKAYLFFTIFLFTASVFAILLIAIDRYIFICKPLHYGTHYISTKILTWVLLFWGMALAIALIPYMTRLPLTDTAEDIPICQYKVVMSNGYLVFMVTITEFLPPLIFIVMYSKIIVVARRHAIEIAVQYDRHRPMDGWQRKISNTGGLIAPFQISGQIIDEGKDLEDEDLNTIRQILYKNYNLQKDLGNSNGDEPAEDLDDVFEADEHRVPRGKLLSDVGLGLTQWRRRAMSSSSAPLVLKDGGDGPSHGRVMKDTPNCHCLKAAQSTDGNSESSRKFFDLNENVRERDAAVKGIENKIFHSFGNEPIMVNRSVKRNIKEDTSQSIANIEPCFSDSNKVDGGQKHAGKAIVAVQTHAGKGIKDGRSHSLGNRPTKEQQARIKNLGRLNNDKGIGTVQKDTASAGHIHVIKSTDLADEKNDICFDKHLASASTMSTCVDDSTADKLEREQSIRRSLVRYFSSGQALTKNGKLTLIESISKFAFSRQKNKEKAKKVKWIKEFKAVKMLGLVVGMYILLNVPIAVIEVVNMYYMTSYVAPWIVSIALCLVITCPAANFLIYVVVRRQFRRAYLRLWSLGRYKKKLTTL